MAITEGRQAQEMSDLGLGDAQQVVEQAREAVDGALDTAAEFIRERPIVALAGALALGWMLGKLASR